MDEGNGGRVVLVSTLIAIVVVILVVVSVGATAAWIGVDRVIRPEPTFPAVVVAPTATRLSQTPATSPRPTRAVVAAPTTPPVVAVAPTAAPTEVAAPRQTLTTTSEIAQAAPDAEPTAADALVVAAVRLPERSTERGSASYEGGRFRLALSGQPSIGVMTPLDANDYDVSADIAPARGRAGLVFLSRSPTTFYRVMLGADGAWALEEADGTTIRTIQSGDDVATRTDAATRVRVVRRDRSVDIWLDGRLLTRWTVPAGELHGQYGVVLRSSDAQGEASFDNLSVATVPSS